MSKFLETRVEVISQMTGIYLYLVDSGIIENVRCQGIAFNWNGCTLEK